MSLYATLLKLKINKAEASVSAHFWGEGSVRAETVKTGCVAVETVLKIESDEESGRIAKLARLAEAGCYVIHTLKNPTPVSYRVVLNGQDFDPYAPDDVSR